MTVKPRLLIRARMEENPEFNHVKIEEHLERRREMFHRNRDGTCTLKVIPTAQNFVPTSSDIKCLRQSLLTDGHGFASSFWCVLVSLIRKKHLMEFGKNRAP